MYTNPKLLFSLALLLCIIVLPSLAQDYSVAPIRLNYNANPGESQSQSITVKNHGNKSVEIVLSVKDFLMQRDGSIKVLEANSTEQSIANYITINPTYFKLNPNQSQSIQVSLEAPVDNFESQWGIIDISSTEEQEAYTADQEISAGLNLRTSVSVYVYHSPRTNNNYEVKISNLHETGQPTDSLRTFNVLIDNVGEKRTRCQLYLMAANLNTAKERKFNQKSFRIYPNTTRNVKLKLPRVLPKGKYSLSAILDYGGETLQGVQTIIHVPPE